MSDTYFGLRRRNTFDEMLKEAMTHRLKIEIIPERRAFDTSINDIDFDDFDLSKYDRRLRLNARVQTDKQVLLHELTPQMFDEIPPTSHLYENNEADTQTTRYVAKELDDEKFSDVITDKSEENRKSDELKDEPKDEPKDEKQEDLQSLHLTSSSSASTEKEEEKKEESREIKSLRNLFLGGEDKSVIELFKRDKKTSTPSEQSREQEEEQPRASFWSRRQVEARSRSHSPEERARGNQMNRRQLETRSRSNSPQEIARGSEWTREQMETRSRSRSPESTNTKSSRGKKKKKLLKEKT